MKNVLLVFGGKSYEHDISIVTASQIFNKTRSENVNFVPLYISRENKMFVYLNKKFNLKDFSSNSKIKNQKQFKEIVFVSGENNKLFVKSIFGLKEYLTIEYAIFATHGGVGENGKLLSVFESMNIKCSCGNVDSLAVCMNKFLFKQVMRGAKIPVVSGFKISSSDFSNKENKEKIELRLRLMKFPLVLKPNNGGSSIGLFVANDKDEFLDKIKQAFEFDQEVIVEKFIQNCREFNVAVLGNSRELKISEIDEPIKNNDLLTFSDKYLASGKTGKGIKTENSSMVSQLRKFPAEINDDLKLRLQTLAVKIFRILNLSGIVRIDFLYDEKSDKIYVCEVNTIPGSLAYYFFNENKIVLNDFIEKLLKIADENYKLNNSFNSEFITNILD